MKTVAVIPAFGRLPLLKHTIERLIKKNGVDHVVVVAWGDDEKKVIEDAGGIFVKHENKPLGKKWNAGFQYARTLKPDACLFVGSSDWVSDNWVTEMSKHLYTFDLIGKRDYYMIDIGKTIRACFWLGYPKGDREKEPIGIGRMISARILDKMDWKPFSDEKNHNMDYMMFRKCYTLGGAIALMESDNLKSLSISTNRWDNMHKFEDHWSDKVPAKSVRLDERILIKEFPEINEIFK
jgi:hypothetical protein